MPSTPSSDFNAFLEAMRGLRILHLGHAEADCDALASAYAMSRLLPGWIGFPRGLKSSARNLAAWLGLEPVIDPRPGDYEYTIIYDTYTPILLGDCMPGRYALFDHHLATGYYRHQVRNELGDGAEWRWLRPLESTCSLVFDLFQEHDLPLDRPAAVALIAGIVTDTCWLDKADAATLRRVAALLEISGLYFQQALAAIESPERQAERRSAVLAALRGVDERRVNGWSVLAARTGLHEDGFEVAAALRRLGDVCVVGFPKRDRAMVVAECSDHLPALTGLHLGECMARLANAIRADDTWGSPTGGRVIAPLSVEALIGRCVSSVVQALAG